VDAIWKDPSLIESRSNETVRKLAQEALRFDNTTLLYYMLIAKKASSLRGARDTSDNSLDT